MSEKSGQCDSCFQPLPVQTGRGRRMRRHPTCPHPETGRVSGYLPRSVSPGQPLIQSPIPIPAPPDDLPWSPIPAPVEPAPPVETVPAAPVVETPPAPVPRTSLPEPEPPIAAEYVPVGSLVEATRRELRRHGKDKTPYGITVLVLARRLDSASVMDLMSGYASLAKEYRAAMVAALAPEHVAQPDQASSARMDPMDEIAARRQVKEGSV